MSTRRRTLVALIMASAGVLVVAGGHDDDEPARARLLASPISQRLVGAWTVAFQLDRARSGSGRRLDPGGVSGTVVFAEDRYGRVSSTELGESTHDGVYDVNFAPFGFSSRAESE